MWAGRHTLSSNTNDEERIRHQDVFFIIAGILIGLLVLLGCWMYRLSIFHEPSLESEIQTETKGEAVTSPQPNKQGTNPPGVEFPLEITSPSIIITDPSQMHREQRQELTPSKSSGLLLPKSQTPYDLLQPASVQLVTNPNPYSSSKVQFKNPKVRKQYLRSDQTKDFKARLPYIPPPITLPETSKSSIHHQAQSTHSHLHRTQPSTMISGYNSSSFKPYF